MRRVRRGSSLGVVPAAPCGDADTAVAKDGEVIDVGGEAVLFPKQRVESGHILVLQSYHATTGVTDEMMVAVLAGPLVRRVARAEVGLGHEPQTLEHLHRAVDG